MKGLFAKVDSTKKSRYMFERGLPEETSSFCDLALLIAERLKDTLGETAIESIRESHSFIGIALVETNEHSRSMSHKAKWLDMLLERKTESGGHIEDYELGYAYNEIGVAYGNTNMLDKAIISFRRSIEIFQGLDDYEDIMLGWPEPNLGFIYWMQGNLEDAENALVEILDIHAEKWGVDDTKSFK
jgi:tetratricopeptide (TPR) repeat protein